MEFRTVIPIKPLDKSIDHNSSILSLGSCFADNMAKRLSRVKFHITASPTGILFNPESIANAIERFASVAAGDMAMLPKQSDLSKGGDRWFSYDFHSSFSHSDADMALENMVQGVRAGAKVLDCADTVIITFGSAFVYRLNSNNKVVANSHKQPQKLFTKQLLTADEIANRYIALLNGPLAGKSVIFTVSPIRHIGDGAELNSLSKATLRVAIGMITSKVNRAHYFPSYEIMYDELRDYRFYNHDMIHPSDIAIEYIWQCFAKAAFTDKTRQTIADIEHIIKAAEHRPTDPQSAAHRQFCTSMIKQIEIMESKCNTIDLHKEKEYFNTYL